MASQEISKASYDKRKEDCCNIYISSQVRLDELYGRVVKQYVEAWKNL